MQLALDFSSPLPGLLLAHKALEGRKSRKMASLDIKRILTTLELKQELGK